MMIATVVLALSLSAGAADPQPPAASTPQEQQTPDPNDQKADAKEPPTPEHTGLRALFGNLGEDVKHLPAMQNVYLAALGGGLAMAAHPFDQTLNAHLVSHYPRVESWWAPGKYIGDTPEQIAMSIGAYAIGRAFDQPKTAHLGMDLVQAQILTEILVEPLKFATHRERP